MLDVRPQRSDDGNDGRAQVTLRDGTLMACRDRGAGPVVILVHGWAASSAFFEDIAARLSTEFRVVCPDLRAHGATPGGTEPLSIPVLADDLAELLADPDLGPAVVVGWSMGALVVWSMIARHGADRLRGLVIEDMSPRILNDAGWALGMSSGMDVESSVRATRSMQDDWTGYVSAFAPRMFARDRLQDDEVLVRFAIDQLAERDPTAMSHLWTSMAREDLRDLLPSIHLPVLVAYGEQSQAYASTTSQYLVDALPMGVAKGFARSGHAPHLEEPEEFARTVSDFARRAHAAASQQPSTDERPEGSIS